MGIAISNYPCQVELTKYFLSGLLEGMKVTEKMGFMSWDDACNWSGKATMNIKCNYVVLELVNLKTGEKENF